MTEKEAVEMIRAKLTCMKLEDLSYVGKGCSRDCDDCEYNYKQGTIGEYEKALEVIIQALEEIQQYRAIGTVEECRAAVEKQKPKKPTEDVYYHKCCPNCGWVVYQDEFGGRYLPHCENCGQAIDWSEGD